MSVYSFITLAYHFTKRILLRLALKMLGLFSKRLHDAYSGFSTFQRNYVEQDYLLPESSQDQTRRIAMSRCTLCGACDALVELSNPTTIRPSFIPTLLSRLPTNSYHTKIIAQTFTSLQLSQFEAVCPQRIPFTQWIGDNHSASTESSSSGTSPSAPTAYRAMPPVDLYEAQ